MLNIRLLSCTVDTGLNDLSHLCKAFRVFHIDRYERRPYLLCVLLSDPGQGNGAKSGRLAQRTGGPYCPSSRTSHWIS
jgi:hypothetical protein